MDAAMPSSGCFGPLDFDVDHRKMRIVLEGPPSNPWLTGRLPRAPRKTGANALVDWTGCSGVSSITCPRPWMNWSLHTHPWPPRMFCAAAPVSPDGIGRHSYAFLRGIGRSHVGAGKREPLY
jgi:hypothetical protein